MRTLGFLVVSLTACGGGSGGSGDGAGDADADADGDGDVPLLCEGADCRGDLTGEWDVRGACLTEFEAQDEQTECPQWSCRVVAAEATGALLFGADGQADVHAVITTMSECHIPLSCVDEGETCDTLEGTGWDGVERTCEPAGDGCDCTEIGHEDDGLAGTWQLVDGRFLEIRNETGMMGGNDFCVGGDELRFSWLVSANSASPITQMILAARRR